MREMDRDKLRQMEGSARSIGETLGRVVKKFTDQNVGFALFVFSFDGPEATYISNADRADMLKMLKEFVERFEEGEPMPTTSTPPGGE
jgi:hypothetical protein